MVQGVQGVEVEIVLERTHFIFGLLLSKTIHPIPPSNLYYLHNGEKLKMPKKALSVHMYTKHYKCLQSVLSLL